MRPLRTALAAVCLLLPAGSSAEPDVQGVLGGLVAVRFDPVSATPGALLKEGLRLSVHMIPESDPGAEYTAPAGEWFLPPGNKERFRIWLEGPGQISQRHWVLVWARVPLGEFAPKPVKVAVGPAALVGLGQPVALAAGESLRLLQLESGFARRVRREQAGLPVQMPPGQVVACIFDDEEGRYAALSRPVAAPAGTHTIVVPQRRAPPLSDLLLHLVRPVRLPPTTEFSVRLRGPTGEVATPDAQGGDTTNIYALFYGITWKYARIEVASDHLWLPETELAFGAGGVTHARLALLEKPSLTVRLVLPENLIGERRVVVEDHGQVVAERELGAGEEEVRLASLPPRRLLVKLGVGIWELRESIDLSAGADAVVVFQPSPHHVHGTVYVGDEPARASVAFLAGGLDSWAETNTDEEGRYAIVLFADTGMARVTPGGSTSPSTEFLDVELTSDTEIDFHLGAAVLQVEVTSADTGAPIEEAMVTVGGAVGRRKGSSTSLGTVTDEDGIARLGPLRPSTVMVKVSKQGWETHTERLEIQDDSPSSLRVALESETDVTILRVTLPDGQPAAQVRAAVFQSLAGGLAWQGLGDGEGAVRVPRRACCVATLLHDAGGLTLVQLGALRSDEELAVRMQPRAAPLRVAAVTADGAPVPWAKVRVWINGQLVGSEVFSMLFRWPLAANWEGVWAVSGLAPAPVEVVCWRAGGGSSLNDQGQAGLFDGQRLGFAYPWPDLIQVPVVQ